MNKKALMITIMLILSMIIVCVPNFVHASTTISRVQGNVLATTTSSSLSAALSNTPASGDVIIAVIGLKGTSPDVNSLSQTGVTWINSFYTSMTGYDLEVWAGIVTSGSASKTTSITLTGTITAGTVDICEYSGLNTAYIASYSVDGTAAKVHSGSSSSIDTTGADTTYGNELWIGGAILNGYSQSTPTYGFSLLDGSANNGVSLSYLEKIVSTTGTAESGTTGAGSGAWMAIMTSFPASPTINLSPNDTEQGTAQTITLAGDGFHADAPFTATYDGNPLTLNGPTTTDSNGAIPSGVTFTVDSSKPVGDHTVTVTDDQSNSCSANHHIHAKIIAAPENSIGVLSALIAVVAALATWTLMAKRAKKSI